MNKTELLDIYMEVLVVGYFLLTFKALGHRAFFLSPLYTLQQKTAFQQMYGIKSKSDK